MSTTPSEKAPRAATASTGEQASPEPASQEEAARQAPSGQQALAGRQAPPAEEATAPSTQVNYVRGQIGGQVDARRVLRSLAAVCVAVLVVLVVVTTVGAAHQNSTQSELQRDGVAVEVTVTSCAGVSSGIGQSLVYYSCRGSYVVNGHRYEEAIGGNRADHAIGQKLEAVAVRSDPSVVSTASAVAKKFSRWTPYITPVVLAVVTVAFVALLGWWSRRRRASQAVGTPTTHPSPQ